MECHRLWRNVSQTLDKKTANFNLTYQKDGPPFAPTTCAQKLFPHQNADVVVYQHGFDVATSSPLKNVFLHELGHVFGLRHEFAGDCSREAEFGAKQIKLKNPLSVMEYNAVPSIQESDKEEIREFYKLKDGETIDKSPVKDYTPTLRWTNQSGP